MPPDQPRHSFRHPQGSAAALGPELESGVLINARGRFGWIRSDSRSIAAGAEGVGGRGHVRGRRAPAGSAGGRRRSRRDAVRREGLGAGIAWLVWVVAVAELAYRPPAALVAHRPVPVVERALVRRKLPERSDAPGASSICKGGEGAVSNRRATQRTPARLGRSAARTRAWRTLPGLALARHAVLPRARREEVAAGSQWLGLCSLPHRRRSKWISSRAMVMRLGQLFPSRRL